MSNTVSGPKIIRAARALKRAQSQGLPKETIDQLSRALAEVCMAGMSQSIPTDIVDTVCTEVLQAMLAVTPKGGAISGGMVNAVLAQGSMEWTAKFLEEEDMVIICLPSMKCTRLNLMLDERCMLMDRKTWEDFNTELEQFTKTGVIADIGVIATVIA